MPTTRADINKRLQETGELWWLADKKGPKDPTGKAVARALNRAATSREIANVSQRWRNLVYYRCMTGRPSYAQLAYGMARRPASFVEYYRRFDFTGVKSRFAATMADVYDNRLLGHQTFVEMIPKEGDAEQNAMSRQISEGMDLADDQMNYWKERNTTCKEAFWYGAAPIGFFEDADGKPVVRSVNPDELLYSNYDDTDPYDVIQRVWGKKTELLEMKGIKGNKEAEEAVLKADNAYPAFYFGRGTVDCSDVVPYLKGWTRPIGKTPGRYVEVIGDYAIKDEKWEYPHPFEWWAFSPLPGTMLGQGIAELLLQISQWIDELLTTIVDADKRTGAPKWFINENSNINPDTLGDLNGAIVTGMSEPKEIRPESIGDWAQKRLEFLMNLGMSIVHVSTAAVKGEMPAGITAAIAIEKYAQIDDQNFLEKIGRLEDFDRRCCYQKIMLFKRLKAKFKSGRREFDWSTVPINEYFRVDDLQAYNVGRLSQTVAGRIQIVETMRDRNRIDDKMYNKFLQTPDIPGMFRDLNAEANNINKQLDTLVKSDDFIPPTPYMDLDYALKQCETRMDREESEGARQDVLDRLGMWRAVVMSYIKQRTTPDKTFGITPPAPVMGQNPAIPPAPPTTLPNLTNVATPQ